MFYSYLDIVLFRIFSFLMLNIIKTYLGNRGVTIWIIAVGFSISDALS